jgi:hypothetical protein
MRFFAALGRALRAAALALGRALRIAAAIPFAMAGSLFGGAADDDPGPAPVVDRAQLDELEAIESDEPAPVEKPRPTAHELLTYLAKRLSAYATESSLARLPDHWPQSLRRWAARLPNEMALDLMSKRMTAIQAHIDEERSIPGVWPVRNWIEYAARADIEAYERAGRPQPTDAQLERHAEIRQRAFAA